MIKKTALVQAITRDEQLSLAAAKRLLASLGPAVARRLLEGETVALGSLGRFRLHEHRARRIADIAEKGKTRIVPAHAVANFEPAARLHTALKAVSPASKADLKSVARATAIAFVDLANTTIPKAVRSLFPEAVMRRYQMVPIAIDEQTLKLAMVDPENREAIELVRKTVGKTVIPFLTTATDLARVLESGEAGTSELRALAEEAEDVVEALPAEKEEKGEAEAAALEHAPAAKLMSQLVKRAVRENASDIHIEPAETTTQIRFRVDGVLRPIASVPRTIHAGLISRIKVLTNLRLDEHRLPQDGRFRTIIDHGEIDFRVSLIPTVDGEKAVLRILDKSAGMLTLDQVGFRGQQLALFDEEIKKPHGMILVTGPTGSGKTTTLYAAIDRLRSVASNITTLEDPVEYRLAGINQSQVRPDIGFTFAAGLRAILRQDPNIILVGEIRDTETADIAINAALTGHVVLSTLHTNDAAGAIPRLLDMGIEPFLITSSVNAVIAQRLVRKICLHCRVTATPGKELVAELRPELAALKKKRTALAGLERLRAKLSRPTFATGKGCSACSQTGYKGRLGVYEILPITDRLRPLITPATDAAKLAAEAEEMGMLTMRQDGVLKALDGLTTLEEVWRVTKT